MLPFLKNKQDAASSSPIESVKREPDEEQEYDTLESAVSDLFDAYKHMDIPSGAAALRAAFDILESQPHEEVDHG